MECCIECIPFCLEWLAIVNYKWQFRIRSVIDLWKIDEHNSTVHWY